MSSRDPFSDLLPAARRGDPAACDALAARFYPRVAEIVHRELDRDFRRSQRWILPLFSTGDVVHDVLGQLCRDLGSFGGTEEAELVAYLAASVRHRLLDALRHHGAGRRDARRRTELADVAAAARAPGTLAAFAEQVEVFHEVLASFPERHRTLLEARLVDRTAFAEIAERLGYASPDVARKLFHQAHARLLLALRARGVRPPGETGG